MKVTLQEKVITNMNVGQNIYSIRSSSLPRFMTCNGSVTLQTPPQEDNDFAAEGTAAHELLERMFEKLDIPETAKNGVVFDEEMFYHCKNILPMIPEHAKCESEIKYPVITDKFEVTGHLDYTWEEDEGRTLVIMDLKYGYRIVEVDNNWQLISYAIGELSLRQKSYEKIILRIVQPRPHHWEGSVREISYTTQQIFEFYQFIQQYAESFLDGHIRFNTSDKCRYCPALGKECPAMNRAFYNAVDVVLDKNVQDDLNNQELSDMLLTYERVKDVFKIKYDAIVDLAKSRIKAGGDIKGFSLEPVYGHRKWTTGIDAENFKMLSGFDLMEQTMISPAQAEKKGLSSDIVKHFTTTEQKGFKLSQLDQTKRINKMFGKPEGV